MKAKLRKHLVPEAQSEQESGESAERAVKAAVAASSSASLSFAGPAEARLDTAKCELLIKRERLTSKAVEAQALEFVSILFTLRPWFQESVSLMIPQLWDTRAGILQNLKLCFCVAARNTEVS